MVDCRRFRYDIDGNIINVEDLITIYNKGEENEIAIFKPTNGLLKTAVILWCTNKDEALKTYGHISNWDTSEITDMSGLFENMFKSKYEGDDYIKRCGNNAGLNIQEDFNDDISNWDVSNVENMKNMFKNAAYFNQPLNNWNVSKVKNMSGMFSGALLFNHPLNSWNVSSVTNMYGMFNKAYHFNQFINTSLVTKDETTYIAWDVSNVENMRLMFREALKFNQDISCWNTSRVKDMGYMFQGAISFDQPINTIPIGDEHNQIMYYVWDVSSVIKMNEMFKDAKSFNQSLDKWNVSSVTDMDLMFRGASSFKQLLTSWNVSSLRDFPEDMFDGMSFGMPDLSHPFLATSIHHIQHIVKVSKAKEMFAERRKQMEEAHKKEEEQNYENKCSIS